MANNIQELTNKEVQTVAVDKQADVKDLNSISAFPVGEFNKDYAQYFSGKSWLAPLNNEEVGIHNVTFEPTSRNDWHVHHGAGQILVVVGVKVGIKKPVNRLKHWQPVMWCTLRLKSNTGMELQQTATSPI